MKHLKSSEPRYSLSNPQFRYVPADQTDIRQTFERIRQKSLPLFLRAGASAKGKCNSTLSA
ncbi:hypothetical protein [Corticibacter populi]|uniref:hypothetical protein n=1 Tax=Corticibacter populi TaxID=1550736 RepID=UPI000F005566|nr:hypothetical protein [Corticibacter populi]RZS35317.1 hypothetical protein EV687_0380 [Corticibacter populi]